MTWLQVIVLAIVQGFTEFLPISSSGHLVLVPHVVGWADQGLAFDVAVHFGSLLAVVMYFHRDLAELLQGGVRLLRERRVVDQPSRLALGILIGTVPAAIAGLAFAEWIEVNLRSPKVVVVTLAFYGIVMALADRLARDDRAVGDVTLRDALIIGVAQALALIPGTSRSGVTITAGRLLGLGRAEAARFSFLLSTPVIVLATGHALLSTLTGEQNVAWLQFGVSALVSAAVAYVCIDLMMRFVSRIGLLPFAIYRLLLAGVVLYVVA